MTHGSSSIQPGEGETAGINWPLLALAVAAAFALVPPVQMRVMQAASEAPGLASSINVGALDFGNASCVAVISLGLGYAAVPIAGGLRAIGTALVRQGRVHPGLRPREM